LTPSPSSPGLPGDDFGDLGDTGDPLSSPNYGSDLPLTSLSGEPD